MHPTERQQRIRTTEAMVASQRAVAETASPGPTRLAAESEMRKYEAILRALEGGCDFDRYSELLAVEAYRF